MRGYIVSWADRHLVIPRWIIFVVYALFFLLGIAAIFAGVPTLDLTTPNGTTLIWGIVIAAAAAVCAVTSFRARFETVERWSALVLVSVLSVYTAGAYKLIADGGPLAASHAAGAVVLTILWFIPAVRLAYMLTRVGLPKTSGGPPRV